MKLIVHDVVSGLGIHPLASNLMILKNCGYCVRQKDRRYNSFIQSKIHGEIVGEI